MVQLCDPPFHMVKRQSCTKSVVFCDEYHIGCLLYTSTSIFDPSSLPDYASFDSRDCPMCKAGQHIDALVNSFGYSAL